MRPCLGPIHSEGEVPSHERRRCMVAVTTNLTAPRPTSSAAGVTWDLADLYKSVDDPRIGRDLDAALARARDFEAAYRSKIDVPGGPSADVLLAALGELEGLSEQMDRSAVYSSLLHAAKTDDPRHGALLTRTREQ